LGWRGVYPAVSVIDERWSVRRPLNAKKPTDP
jgi:hypothetical protein